MVTGSLPTKARGSLFTAGWLGSTPSTGMPAASHSERASVIRGNRRSQSSAATTPSSRPAMSIAITVRYVGSDERFALSVVKFESTVANWLFSVTSDWMACATACEISSA